MVSNEKSKSSRSNEKNKSNRSKKKAKTFENVYAIDNDKKSIQKTVVDMPQELVIPNKTGKDTSRERLNERLLSTSVLVVEPTFNPMQKPDWLKNPNQTVTSIFKYLLLLFTIILIITTTMLFAQCFIFLHRVNHHPDENLDEAQTEVDPESDPESDRRREKLLKTLDAIFLFIEFLYYMYGLYDIYYDKFESILCFGVSVLVLTLIWLIVMTVFRGEIVVLCIEAIYSLLVIAYGWLADRHL